MNQLIGITGPAQNGKDTIADYLVREHGFTRFAFADKLKDFVYAQDPIILTDMFGDNDRLQVLVDDMGWEKAKTTFPEVGRLLQVTGTEAAREVLGEDVWVDAVKRDAVEVMARGGKVVLSDVSFQNEADMVRLYGGPLIRVLRPGHDNGRDPNHISEYNRREGLKVDKTIINDGSLDQLLAVCRTLFGSSFLRPNLVTAFRDDFRAPVSAPAAPVRVLPAPEEKLPLE